MPRTSTHYWVDTLSYEIHLPGDHKPPWEQTDDWAALEQAARLCIDPYTQISCTIVLYDRPRPRQVREFASLIREIYNSPTRTWPRKHSAVVTFSMDTNDTYLGVKVAASLCGLRWRHR